MGPNDDKTLSRFGEAYIKISEEGDLDTWTIASQAPPPKLRAYDDGAGVATIGFGCTEGVHFGMTISPDAAETMFKREIEKFIDAVHRLITRPVSQGLFDALTSFFYNNGYGKCQTLIAAVNGGDETKIRSAWMLYTHAHDEKTGRTVEWPGLVKRRRTELALWQEVDREGTPLAMPAGSAAVVSALEPPHPAMQMATSRTVWGVATGFIAAVGHGFQKAVDYVSGMFGNFSELKANVDEMTEPVTSMLGMLHIHQAEIEFAIAIAAIAVALLRYAEKQGKVTL